MLNRCDVEMLLGELYLIQARTKKNIADLIEIVEFLELKLPATALRILQKGGPMQVGGKGTFQLQPNGALQAGSAVTWAVDNPKVALTPSTDGLTVVAADDPTDTAPTFKLSVNAVSSDGAALTQSLTVQLQSPTVQAPNPATAIAIAQIT